MSGSRGEANFVWRCKNCKVETSTAPHQPGQELTGVFRESRRRASKTRRGLMRRANLQKGRAYSNSTSAASSLSSLSQRSACLDERGER